MPKLEWKASAVADLMAIVDYISDDSPDAALALMDEIQGKVEQPKGFWARLLGT